MKNICLLLILLYAASCDTDQKGRLFKVTGKISGGGNQLIYLEHNPPENPPVVMDSFQLKPDGSFELSANAKEQSLYSLRLGQNGYPIVKMVNDGNDVVIDAKADGSDYKVSGSYASEALKEFDRSINQKAHSIFSEGRMVDSLMKTNAADSLKNMQFGKFQMASFDLKQYVTRFISESKNPVLVVYAFHVMQNVATQIGIPGFNDYEARTLLGRAKSKFPDHSALTALEKQYQPKLAPDFTLPDTSGNNIALSSLRGKYVLVDFWASWCVPCRKENPNIVRTFNQFRDRNFTILGVSLDYKREPWLQAIKDDGLTWTQVSDLGHWNSAAAQLYNVRSIPYNFLLDPQGNIIAENLTGGQLAEVLEMMIK